MSKISVSNRTDIKDQATLRLLREMAGQINQLSEGKIAANYSAQSSVPTSGSYAQGDFVLNSAPEELGTTPNKYVIIGWQFVDVGGGTLDFVERRCPTGN